MNNKVKIGDVLYCHTPLIMDDQYVESIIGKFYPIIDVDGYNIFIYDESGDKHLFSTRSRDESYYEQWFDIVPEEEIELDFFGDLD